LLVGPPPGRSHLVGWFEPGLQAPMAKAFAFRLSGLYATKLRYGGHEEPPVCRGICKFPRRRFHQNRHVVEGQLEEILKRSHLLHQSIHFFSTEYVLFQRTCTTGWFVDARVSRIRAWKEFKFLQKCYEIPGRLTQVRPRFGKSKTRINDAKGLQADPPRGTTRLTHLGHALHRRCQTSRYQRPRRECKHHHLHPGTVPSHWLVLGDGYLRAEDSLRKPSRQTRLLTPFHVPKTQREPVVPLEAVVCSLDEISAFLDRN